MATKTLDELLEDARAEEGRKARAAQEAATAHNIAEHELGRWESEVKLRRPLAHAGLDDTLRRVPSLLRRRLADLYPKLCMEGVAAVSPETLADLAAIYLATSPEFAAVLHGLLDEDPPHGLTPLLDMTTEEHRAERAVRKAELGELARRRDAAGAELAAASQRVSRLELGHVDRPRR